MFSLGSNQGDRLHLLQVGIHELSRTPGLTIDAVSPVYLTRPVDAPDQPDFHNLVAVGTSTLEPLALLRRALVIELRAGRIRTIHHGPRALDIDLIKVGEETYATPELRLPHPAARQRAFVLVPWLDVDPEARLPDGRVADLAAGIDRTGLRRLGAPIIACA